MSVAAETAKPSGSDWVAPDCRGMNFFARDGALRDLLAFYLEPEARAHLWPHFDRLGALAGGELDELAMTADRHQPILHHRDRFGRDRDWIEYHPAYRAMEQIAYGDFGLHAMSHRGGVLGWPAPMPSVAKYAFQYLFVQGEFGLMCPISVTDTSIRALLKFGDEALRAFVRERMLTQDLRSLWKGTQFMTEKAGGSDVGNIESEARLEGGVWRIHGDKWFCSHADADVAVLLARPAGAPAGGRGLGLFAVPRQHPRTGERNRYAIVRLKEKLGTRSMASGEIRFDGAEAWPVGDLGQGLKQMLDQVNMSRLSHGVRAAAMMRRCLNEALVVARNRRAFGRPLRDFALMRRQLLKLMLPSEQALSVSLYAADLIDRAERRGDEAAAATLRIVTPLLKYRACRDNILVATGAMEVRGGNGYIEDWVNAKLIRDAHVGVLWEGTSNINALDVLTRAIARLRAHEALAEDLRHRLAGENRLPVAARERLLADLDGAVALADRAAARADGEDSARQVAATLYHAMSAALLAQEGARAGAGLDGASGDASRLVLSRMVADHRLRPRDPFADAAPQPAALVDALIDGQPIDLATASAYAAA